MVSKPYNLRNFVIAGQILCLSQRVRMQLGILLTVPTVGETISRREDDSKPVLAMSQHYTNTKSGTMKTLQSKCNRGVAYCM